MNPGVAAGDSSASLGPLVREFEPNRERLWFFVALLGTAALFFFSLGIRNEFFPPQEPPGWGSRVFSVLFCGGFGLGNCVWARTYVLLLRRRWRLHEGGLVLIEGNRRYVIPWDTVDEIFETTTVANMHGMRLGAPNKKIRLVTRDGLNRWLDEYVRGVEALLKPVSEAVNRSLSERVYRRLQTNRSARFDAVELSESGVKVGVGAPKSWLDRFNYRVFLLSGIVVLRRGRWAWSELETIRIELTTRGRQSFCMVIIQAVGQTKPIYACPVLEFPNLTQLLEVCRQLGHPADMAE
jgi:hypothetical protein